MGDLQAGKLRDRHLRLLAERRERRIILYAMARAHKDLTVVKSARALNAISEIIKGALSKGGVVQIRHFGTFYVRKRPAKAGHDPRSGGAIKIKPAKVPVMRFAADFRRDLDEAPVSVETLP